MSNELYSIIEFSKITNICRTRVYELINTGQLKAKKLGKRTFITQEALDEFIENLPPYLSQTKEGK